MADRSARRGGPVDVDRNTRDSGEDGWAKAKPDAPGTPNGDADYFGGIKKFSNYSADPAAAPNRDAGADWKPGKR